MENSDVIEFDMISISEDTCCLCLDNKCNLRLNCCRNNMHSDCLFSIFLKDMYDCPLCRKPHKPSNYFDLNQFHMMLYNIDTNILDFKLVDKVLLDICDKKWFRYYYHKICTRLVKFKCGVIYVACCENIMIMFTIIVFYLLIFSLVTFLYLI